MGSQRRNAVLHRGVKKNTSDAGEQQQAQQQRDQKSGIEEDAKVLRERAARFRIEWLIRHGQSLAVARKRGNNFAGFAAVPAERRGGRLIAGDQAPVSCGARWPKAETTFSYTPRLKG